MSEDMPLDDGFLGEEESVVTVSELKNETGRPRYNRSRTKPLTIARRFDDAESFWRTRRTLPAQPRPSTRMSSKSSIVTFFLVLLLDTVVLAIAEGCCSPPVQAPRSLSTSLALALSGSAEAGLGSRDASTCITAPFEGSGPAIG